MRNLSKHFTNPTLGFLHNLELSDSQKSELQDAKSAIMARLKIGITVATDTGSGQKITPRFMSQGSSVYKTQNRPCQTPPQQIDHDLGCYLPMSLLKEEQPKIAAATFFELVDGILEELVTEKGWQALIKSKSTCSRVVVNHQLHVDIPLYSIPDDQYGTITEAAFSRTGKTIALDSAYDETWSAVEDRVLLAHRIVGWKPSDPRKLNSHFKSAFKIKGNQLRRVCRYLKAWRDFQWTAGACPSSIALMILADESFPAQTELERDDLALLRAMQHISQIQGAIENPTDRSEKIDLSANLRLELTNRAKRFAADLHKAIHDPSLADGEPCKLIQAHLGNRFPSCDSLPPAKDDSHREVVLKNPAQRDERPPVGRTQAG